MNHSTITHTMKTKIYRIFFLLINVKTVTIQWRDWFRKFARHNLFRSESLEVAKLHFIIDRYYYDLQLRYHAKALWLYWFPQVDKIIYYWNRESSRRHHIHHSIHCTPQCIQLYIKMFRQISAALWRMRFIWQNEIRGTIIQCSTQLCAISVCSGNGRRLFHFRMNLALLSIVMPVKQYTSFPFSFCFYFLKHYFTIIYVVSSHKRIYMWE